MASTATATPQVAADIVARLGLREPVRVTTGFDRPNLSFAVVPCRGAADKRARIAGALADDGARPAIVYAGTRAETEDLAGAAGGRARDRGAGLPRRPRAPGARRGPAALHGRRGRGRRRHQRVRHGRRQVRRADRRARHRAGVGRGLLPGGRARGPRRAPVARAALRREPRQGPARVLHPARRGRRRGARGGGRARCCAPRSTAATTCRCRRAGDPEPERVRAIVGHLARAGVVRPAPAPIDRLRGRVARRLRRAGAGDVPVVGGGCAARPLAPVPRGVGLRRGRRVPARGDPAPLRRSRAAARRGAVLRRLRARARARAAPRAAEPSPGGPRRRATSTRRSSTWSPAPSPSVGRTRTVEILRGGRSQVVRKNAYDGLPAYGDVRPPARGRGAGARRRAARRGAAGLHRRRLSRSCGWRRACRGD